MCTELMYLCTDNIRHYLFKLCLSYFTSAARRPSYKSIWARLEKPRPSMYVVVDTYVYYTPSTANFNDASGKGDQLATLNHSQLAFSSLCFQLSSKSFACCLNNDMDYNITQCSKHYLSSSLSSISPHTHKVISIIYGWYWTSCL